MEYAGTKLKQKLNPFPLTVKTKEYAFATAHTSNPFLFALKNKPTCLKLDHKHEMYNYLHDFLVQNIRECRPVHCIQGSKYTLYYKALQTVKPW